MSNEPSWLSDSPAASPVPQKVPGDAPEWADNDAGASAPAPKAASAAVEGKHPMYYALFLMNLGMAIFECAAGVLAIMFSTNGSRSAQNIAGRGDVMCQASNIANCSTAKEDLGNIFVGIYMVVFSSIIIVHELIQLCPCQSLDLVMKKTFGFLYGSHGKSSFFIFMSVLPSGLVGVTVSIACAITVGTWGALHSLIYLMRPEYFPKLTKYDPKMDD